MTGVWDNTRRADVTNKAIPGFVESLPYTAWGKSKWDGYEKFMQTNGDYVGNCLPFGMSRSIYGPHPLQIIHDNDNLVMLFEQNSMFHIVPTDGRAFTKDLPASWFGESVGHWDGRDAGRRDSEPERLYASGYYRSSAQCACPHHPDIQTRGLQHHRAHVHRERSEDVHECVDRQGYMGARA
jgi:hypothetical protein